MTTYAMRDTRDRKAGGVPVCGFALPLAAWVTMGIRTAHGAAAPNSPSR
jgi:hypothetical protein